jgi:hypothetical protein
MKQLQRLLLHQGQRCFFCDAPIPEGEASIEHLAAVSNGGASADDNCVVCCKTLNAAMGNISIKEKLRLVLAQRAAFTCPRAASASAALPSRAPLVDDEDLHKAVLANLRKYGSKRPKKLGTLKNALKVSFPTLDSAGIDSVVSVLQEQGYVAVSGTSVSYHNLGAGT